MMFHRSDKYSFSPDEYSEYTSDHMLPLRKKNCYSLQYVEEWS